jgi:GT2 family glycosyltransferase
MGDAPSGGQPGPPVSIVVCTYRREGALRLLLEDLLAQEGIAAEILVIDQTPEHEPETDALLAGDPNRLRHICIAEPNLPNARNRGIELAQGEIAIFIDDDLRVGPDFVRRLVAHFEDPEVEGVAPLVVVEGEEPPGRFAERMYRFGRGWRVRKRIRVPHVIGACMAFRLPLVRRLGGFDPLLGRLNPTATGEDGDFCRRWSRAGHALWLAPGVQALHRMGTPGGCDTRFLPLGESMRQHRRALAYMVLKEERSPERISVRGWMRLLRGNVVRRDVLQAGPVVWRQAVRGLRDSLREARAFRRLHSDASTSKRAPAGSARPQAS